MVTGYDPAWTAGGLPKVIEKLFVVAGLLMITSAPAGAPVTVNVIGPGKFVREMVMPTGTMAPLGTARVPVLSVKEKEPAGVTVTESGAVA
jgi:hypothetical protein